MKKVFSKIIFCLIVLSLIIPITKTQAVYQSRPGFKEATNNASGWFTSIRQMEASGGILGLSANINTSTYLDSSGNGVDVHMIKNSEWGAIVMLSLSAYGGYNGYDATTINTYSTGSNNYTGVYGLGTGSYWEYTATSVYCSDTNSYSGAIAVSSSKDVDSRYYDTYTVTSDMTYQSTTAFWSKNYTGSIVHHGDALYELNTFVNDKQPSTTRWTVSASYPWFLRGSGSALASNVSSGNSSYASRAVVVCGSGL
jgi:hypothetical protein